MTKNEKNRIIEKYIRDLSSKVTLKYGRELIGEDRISNYLTMFKDSEKDLTTEIIPQINELVQQVVDHYLECLWKLDRLPDRDSIPKKKNTVSEDETEESEKELENKEQINQMFQQPEKEHSSNEKPKVKSLTPSASSESNTSSNGYINILILSFIICGSLFMIFTFLLWK